MHEKVANIPTAPTKRQTLVVSYKNRDYIICSEGQMNYVKIQARELLLCTLAEQQQTLDEEQFAVKIDEWLRDECRYATLDYVLGLMTEKERQAWKDNYRFSAVLKRK